MQMTAEEFLVDTSVWVKCFRGIDILLNERIASLMLENRAFTSEIIIMEILRGAKSDKEYSMLYQDFLALPRLTLDREVWETAWNASYKLRKSGLNTPIADVIIASTAMYYKCTLMHSDKHFNLIAKHTELKIIEL